MLASVHFHLSRTASDDWFDPILDADTELFVDPFLIFKESKGFWSSAHKRLIDHFDRAFLDCRRRPESKDYPVPKSTSAARFQRTQRVVPWEYFKGNRWTWFRVWVC